MADKYYLTDSDIAKLRDLIAWRDSFTVRGASRVVTSRRKCSISVAEVAPGKAVDSDLILLRLSQNGGLAGTDQTSACSFTYDIYNFDDESLADNLNGGTPVDITGHFSPLRALKLEMVAATYGVGFIKDDGTYGLLFVDEYPANEEDCTDNSDAEDGGGA